MTSERIELEEFIGIIEEGSKGVVFDIETAPESEDKLKKIFDESKVRLPKDPGVFNPMAVKYGNAKNPEKKAEIFQRAQERHVQAMQEHHMACLEKVSDAYNSLVEEAALYAHTGKVIAIGYGIFDASGEFKVCLEMNDNEEENLLAGFWWLSSKVSLCGGKFFTFNGKKFDFPFIINRSWVHDLEPQHKYYFDDKWRYSENFVDALEIWTMGRNPKNKPGLDALAKIFGYKGKYEGVKGKDFHKVLKKNPEEAILYLASDIEATKVVCERMGLI